MCRPGADTRVRPDTRGRTRMLSRLFLLVVALPGVLLAQTQSTEVHIKFNSGQSITPIYEGWERVPDGSFNMVFGYLNRNHVEQISLPIGAQNNFEPGPADRGQPAYFYPRENHFIFKVNVPKDWDTKKELVWSLTVRGKTEQARATLMDIWEIDRKVEVSNNGGPGDGRDTGHTHRQRHRRWHSAAEHEAPRAASGGAVVEEHRIAVAGQRADAGASASTAGRRIVGLVVRVSRSGRGDLRSGRLRQNRRR